MVSPVLAFEVVIANQSSLLAWNFNEVIARLKALYKSKCATLFTWGDLLKSSIPLLISATVKGAGIRQV